MGTRRSIARSNALEFRSLKCARISLAFMSLSLCIYFPFLKYTRNLHLNKEKGQTRAKFERIRASAHLWLYMLWFIAISLNLCEQTKQKTHILIHLLITAEIGTRSIARSNALEFICSEGTNASEIRAHDWASAQSHLCLLITKNFCIFQVIGWRWWHIAQRKQNNILK
jgi:hypothetical protein